MKGFLNLSGINRIFILGAGFSAPAGIPLTHKLLKEIHSIASKEFFLDESTPYGQADWLLDQLKFYYPLSNFSHEMIENEEYPNNFDLEEFISFISVESACQWRTGERFDEHGNQFLSYLKRWIAKVINNYQKKALSRIPNFYHNFISLTKNSLIMTFNWDTLLESLIDLNNLPYELDSRSNFNTNITPIFKLHGSIDWFSHPEEIRYKNWMELNKLGESFNGLYRATTKNCKLEKYYDSQISPWIVVPSYDKVSQIQGFGDMWTALYMFFQNELEVIIIGYSMRNDDYHSRSIIYPQLVQGSQNGFIKLKVIDLADSQSDKASIRNKYEGIEDCKFFFKGFSNEAIEFIK